MGTGLGNNPQFHSNIDPNSGKYIPMPANIVNLCSWCRMSASLYRLGNPHRMASKFVGCFRAKCHPGTHKHSHSRIEKYHQCKLCRYRVSMSIICKFPHMVGNHPTPTQWQEGIQQGIIHHGEKNWRYMICIEYPHNLSSSSSLHIAQGISHITQN